MTINERTESRMPIMLRSGRSREIKVLAASKATYANSSMKLTPTSFRALRSTASVSWPRSSEYSRQSNTPPDAAFDARVYSEAHYGNASGQHTTENGDD